MDSPASHEQPGPTAAIPPEHLAVIAATIGAILVEGMLITGVVGLGGAAAPVPGDRSRRWIDEGREAASRTHQPWGIEDRWGRSSGA